MQQKEALKNERNSLLKRLEHAMEGPLIFLGFVWLVLLIVDLIWGLNPLLQNISYVIWIVFILDYILKFTLAPEKWHFVKKNWLTAISLLVPALRLVRILRVLRLFRGMRLIKIVTSVNRSMKSLGATFTRRGFGYVIALTIGIIFAGAAGMYAFENEQARGFTSYAEALYWTTMLLTSLGSEYWPVTPEGRALCLLLGIYGFCVFGYITATLASFFVGRDAEEEDAPVAGAEDVKKLQLKIDQLTQAINELKAASAGK